ncbi:MarR family winged helix-turn-helix transcriptional regulator [Macrococcus carouselicus]|uniref:HTH-type transcriptional regulator SarZ n=1 Tax=Macrococcus carouselicus TaxID=69969 RepID=A0A9Q8FQ49_9STAP|nr:MarR family transcriptional regulator [Macrococcus carouselicus]TDM03623.1 MarR family transcriptional regulator [Macrococcus carouselicus]
MKMLRTTNYQLYHAQREVIRHYNRTLLHLYNISYQQYLVLMVLNEADHMPVLKLGERLAFQSGTITPIIKKMEAAGLVKRNRKAEDERIVLVSMADKGLALIKEIQHIPEKMLSNTALTMEEYRRLMFLTHKITHNLEE